MELGWWFYLLLLVHLRGHNVSEAAVSPSVLTTFPPPPPVPREHRLSTFQWGMITFLVSEVAFFSTLIVTYVIYIGKDASGPTPAILSLPLVLCTTICLLSSSGTIHLAEKSLNAGSRPGFFLWWSATIVLGVLFLAGTVYEWNDLITHEGLTISRNLFGTTYYTLVEETRPARHCRRDPHVDHPGSGREGSG